MAHRGFFVQPDKMIKPCCVFREFDEPLYYDSNKTFDELFNSPQFIDLRKKLAAGVKHPGCADCWSGRTSHREGMNRMYSYPEYEFTPSLYEKDIFYLDLRVGNLCNFKCRMCNPVYSSSWADEVKKNNINIEFDSKELRDFSNIGKVTPPSDDWLTPLVSNLDKVSHIYLGGGEPLIMKETYELLDALESRKDKIELFINTNLSTLKYKDVDIFTKFNGFKQVNWFLSCDGLNDVGEYQRTGFKTDRFLSNLKTVSTQSKAVDKVTIRIIYAISAVTVFDIFNTVETITKHIDKDDLLFDFQIVDSPWFYSLRNVSPELKEKVSSFIQSNIVRLKDPQSIDRINSLLDFMEKPPRRMSGLDINNSHLLIDTVDKIRNESLYKVAPWMEREISIWKNII